MLGRVLGLAAASALGVTAFLIPAGITPPEGVADISVSLIGPNKNEVVLLRCPACAFPYKSFPQIEQDGSDESDDTFRIQGGANNILMNFTVTDDRVLELNGQAIYPFSAMDFGPVVVEQVPASLEVEDIERGGFRAALLEVTAAGITTSGEEELTPSGDVLIPLTYSIIGLEGQDMFLDRVYITLLRTFEGELLLLSVQVLPTTNDQPFHIVRPLSSGPDNSDGEEAAADDDFVMVPLPFKGPPMDMEFVGQAENECGRLPVPICKIKNIIESKFNEFRRPSTDKKKPGCGGRKDMGKLPGHIKPGFLHPEVQKIEDDAPAPFDEGRPHHFRPHHGYGHGHHHRHRHSFAHALARGFAAIVIPTMAGVAVGMIVSLVGLCIGRLVVFLWTRFRRGNQHGYIALASDGSATEESGESGESDEKIVYTPEQQAAAPPAYDAAPAYEERV